MWVFNQHVVWPSVAPFKGQSPLAVDPHMPRIVVKLQVIAGWQLHEVGRRCAVELRKLARCRRSYGGEPLALPCRKQLMRVRV